MQPRIAVVLPARNEAPRIGSVLAALRLAQPGAETIVVDDGSSDETRRVARDHGASRVVSHRVSLGKGAALRTGCEAALADGCDLIVLMDADGQHRPEDVGRLVAALTAGQADLAIGYRSFSREMPAAMRLGNWGLSSLFWLIFGRDFRDTQCGLRGFRAESWEKLRWEAIDYSVESEMLVRAVSSRLRIVEVPISTLYDDRYKGTTPADGVRILAEMVRWRLSR